MNCLGWESTVESDNSTTTSTVPNDNCDFETRHAETLKGLRDSAERDPIRHRSLIPRRRDNSERFQQPTTPPIPDLSVLNTLASSTASRIARPTGPRATRRVYINLHMPDVLPQAENRDWRLRPRSAHAPPTPIVRSRMSRTKCITLEEEEVRQQKGRRPRRHCLRSLNI
jgi:hypothetical protein